MSRYMFQPANNGIVMSHYMFQSSNNGIVMSRYMFQPSNNGIVMCRYMATLAISDTLLLGDAIWLWFRSGKNKKSRCLIS